MNKVVISLAGFAFCLSSRAQVIKIYHNNGSEPVATYINQGDNQYKVVFEEYFPEGSRGTAKATLTKDDPMESDVAWVQLWENGLKFATFNAGGDNVLDYGFMLSWGYTVNNSCVSYWSTEGDYDSARKLWGNLWRMPTKADFEALSVHCDAEWTDSYKDSGVAGIVFRGRGDFSFNTLFFPASGYYRYEKLTNRDTAGYYWTSDTPNDNASWYFTFTKDNHSLLSSTRAICYSVRPVLR